MKNDQLMTYLLYLKLSYFREYHQSMAKEAVEKNWSQLDFLKFDSQALFAYTRV